MKQLGYVLLGIGFLMGAFFVVETSESVRWVPFGVAAVFMLTGVGLVRVTSAAGAAEAVHEDLEQLERSLDSLLVKLAALRAEESSLVLDDPEGVDFVYDVGKRIDADLAEDIAGFVEVRDTLKQRFDLQTYADVMSAFALGERHVNRAWSASADGYVDEVWRCLGIAEEDMRKARTLLDAAKSA